jgi:DNA-binding MarR family transcriptional regulator
MPRNSFNSFNFPSSNIRNKEIYKFISFSQKNYDTYHTTFLRSFSKKLSLKNYDTFYNTSLRCFSKKPGPRDGWHGITLKILNYIAKRNGCSIRDLCEVFNIARQTIHYHINKLLKAGLIMRYPPNAKKHDPYVIYVPICCNLESPPSNSKSLTPFFNGAKAPASPLYQIIKILSIRPQTPSMLREKLKIPKRTLSYYIRKLIKAGLIIRAGGRCCRYAYLILTPKPINLEHSHKFTRYHKRYRRKCKI